ncbi:MAG: tetratricopeptide repeat-containing sensor histidine kinase [Cyclobacteriaceae bacterium]
MNFRDIAFLFVVLFAGIQCAPAQVLTKEAQIKRLIRNGDESRSSYSNHALEQYNQALEMAEDHYQHLLPQIYNGLSVVYSYKGDHKVSTENALKAFEVARIHLDSIEMIDALHNVGIEMYYQDILNDADDYFQRALDLSKAHGDSSRIANSMINLGLIQGEFGNIATEKKYYNEAREIFILTNNLEGIATTTLNLGEVLRLEGKFIDAKYYLEDALSRFQALKHTIGIVEIYSSLAELYFESGELDQAIKICNEGMRLSSENGYAYDMLIFLDLLKTHYQQQADFNQAYTFQEQYILLSDSINSIEKVKQMLELEERFDANEKEREIALLQTETELANARISQVESQRTFLIIIVVLVIAASLFVFYLYRKINQSKQVIESQNVQLQELINAKEKLFGVIAHDLKGPLSAFMNMSGLLAKNVGNISEDQVRVYLTKMESSAINLRGLLNNLLEWSLSQTQMLSTQPELVVLGDVSEHTIELLQDMATLKGISLSASVDDHIVRVTRNHLQTIMRNLVSNAIKFTGEGGSVTIHSELAEDGITIKIEDTGIGMTEDELSRLFKVNEDIAKIGESDEKGTGLGLLLCKELIERNDGYFSITSQKNIGTAFCFTFPKA